MFSFCELTGAYSSPLGFHRETTTFEPEDNNFASKSLYKPQSTNTQKQRDKTTEDLRKDFLDLSTEKLSSNCSLRLCVLIKNTIKRLDAEQKAEKRRISFTDVKKHTRSTCSVTFRRMCTGFNDVQCAPIIFG